mmetsp:Transcript_33359/g.97175  ORF Transcript_33359/g.97175 Transcript_33359/m.97175 type:complete len:239 (-) Transcript_33359:1544-2260(-)
METSTRSATAARGAPSRRKYKAAAKPWMNSTNDMVAKSTLYNSSGYNCMPRRKACAASRGVKTSLNKSAPASISSNSLQLIWGSTPGFVKRPLWLAKTERRSGSCFRKTLSQSSVCNAACNSSRSSCGRFACGSRRRSSLSTASGVVAPSDFTKRATAARTRNSMNWNRIKVSLVFTAKGRLSAPLSRTRAAMNMVSTSDGRQYASSMIPAADNTSAATVMLTPMVEEPVVERAAQRR